MPETNRKRPVSLSPCISLQQSDRWRVAGWRLPSAHLEPLVFQGERGGGDGPRGGATSCCLFTCALLGTGGSRGSLCHLNTERAKQQS